MADVDWSRMTLDDWDRLISACLRDRDFKGVAGCLATMSTHGYAREAEDLRAILIAALEAKP